LEPAAFLTVAGGLLSSVQGMDDPRDFLPEGQVVDPVGEVVGWWKQNTK